MLLGLYVLIQFKRAVFDFQCVFALVMTVKAECLFPVSETVMLKTFDALNHLDCFTVVIVNYRSQTLTPFNGRMAMLIS